MRQAVILGAGESSRFWPLNSQHKSLIKIMGKPLIFYLLKGLQESGIEEIIIVQSPKRDIEKELTPFNFSNLKFVIQEKPLGTGNALLKAEKLLKDDFLLMNAERLDARDYLKDILEKAERRNLVILAGPTKTPHLFGILKVKGDKVLDIIEKPKKEQAPSNLRNIGFYFLPIDFFDYLKRIPPHPYSLVQAIVLYAKEKEVKMAFTEKRPLFLKFPWDLFRYEEYLFDNFLEDKIGQDTEISKNAKIKGKVQIGRNVKIYRSEILGPCYIGDNTIVETNSLICKYSNLENNTYIGSFTQIKNCICQKNIKIHSGFFGYSIMAQNCEIGAGTVLSCMRFDKEPVKTTLKGERVSTGLRFFGAVLGENTKIGVNCSLMPGVMIGKDCIIGPHSFVKENIEDEKLFYTKFENFKK